MFVLDWARNQTTALTTARGPDVMPTWTPDGDRIVFGSNRDGTVYNLYWRAADGSGPEVRLTNSPNMQVPFSWSKDGKTLFYGELDPKGSGDIYGLPVGEPVADRKPRPLVTTAASEGWPMLSPDQRWLAYDSIERGTSEIMVRPYPDVNSAIYHVAIGAVPRWAQDGSAIYYWRDNRIFRVPVTTSPDFKSGKPEEIITGVLPLSRGDFYDIEPKGKRFVVAKADEEPFADQYRLVVNWIEEVKARMGQRR